MVGRAGVLSPVQAGDRMAPWPALLVLALAFALAACSGPRGGGYYRDDGPGRAEPADVSAIPDAVPRHEPVRAANTRPYVALGRRYVPMTERAPYRETGVASWYGRRFHGQPTASGERYDMYAMTAAHPTLPLPSYVRVTNLSNSRSVIVRVNDRGPFLQGRLIDLSWTAAKKLDFVHHGHTRVLVEVVEPGDAPAATPPVMTAGQVERRDVAAAPVAPTNPAPVPVVPVVRAVPSTAAGTQEAAAATPTAVLGQAEEAPDAPRAEEAPRVPTGFVLVRSAAAVPVPAAAPPAPQVATTATPADGALYLQLAAFQSRENALAALAQLGERHDWLADRLTMYADGGRYKVQAGPWTSSAHAEGIAARLRAEAGIDPFTVRR